PGPFAVAPFTRQRCARDTHRKTVFAPPDVQQSETFPRRGGRPPAPGASDPFGGDATAETQQIKKATAPVGATNRTAQSRVIACPRLSCTARVQPCLFFSSLRTCGLPATLGLTESTAF